MSKRQRIKELRRWRETITVGELMAELKHHDPRCEIFFDCYETDPAGPGWSLGLLGLQLEIPIQAPEEDMSFNAEQEAPAMFIHFRRMEDDDDDMGGLIE